MDSARLKELLRWFIRVLEHLEEKKDRPHQSLGYKTPAEVYFGYDTKNYQTARYLKKANFVP